MLCGPLVSADSGNQRLSYQQTFGKPLEPHPFFELQMGTYRVGKYVAKEVSRPDQLMP